MTAVQADDQPRLQENRPQRARVTWLVMGTLVSVLAYSLTTASKSWCRGGYNADGAYVDEMGNPIDGVPLCLGVQLHPSGAVYAVIAFIAGVAIVYAFLSLRNLASVQRVIDQATAAIGMIAFGSLILAHLWFGQVSTVDWDGSTAFDGSTPTVIANTTVRISPMDAD